jgi:hypothetical protein
MINEIEDFNLEIDSLRKIISQYRRNLYQLELQKATFGSHVPSHILLQIDDINVDIDRNITKLNEAIKKKKDLENDYVNNLEADYISNLEKSIEDIKNLKTDKLQDLVEILNKVTSTKIIEISKQEIDKINQDILITRDGRIKKLEEEMISLKNQRINEIFSNSMMRNNSNIQPEGIGKIFNEIYFNRHLYETFSTYEVNVKSINDVKVLISMIISTFDMRKDNDKTLVISKPLDSNYMFFRKTINKYTNDLLNYNIMIDDNHKIDEAIYNIAVTEHWMGNYISALTYFSKMNYKLEEYSNGAIINIALLFSYLGFYREAVAVYMLSQPKDMLIYYNIIVALYNEKGIEHCRLLIEEALAFLCVEKNLISYIKLYSIAGLCAILNEKSTAFIFLKKVVKMEDSTRLWAYHDIAWKNFHSDPEFMSVIGNT